MLHVKVHVRYLVVERAFGDLDFRRFLAHREEYGPHFGLPHRKYIVLEKECAYGYKGHKHHQRAHDTEQGYTCGFHGRKLEFLPKIAECHQRCQKHGKGKGGRHHRKSRIEEEFGYNIECKSFSNKVLDITPQELHQYNEQADEECHGKQRQEALQHETI